MLLEGSYDKEIGRLPCIVRCRVADIKARHEAIVLTTEPAWQAVKEIGINPHQLIYVEGNTEAAMAALAEACKGEVVYGIGGGLAIDTAKYVASANGLPLIALPTILSTDAFLTDATGVRENGCVRYLPTKTPDTVIIDMDMLGNAPAPMRASGGGGCSLNCNSTMGLAKSGGDGGEPLWSTDYTADNCHRADPSPNASRKRNRDRQRHTYRIENSTRFTLYGGTTLQSVRT